MFAESGLDLGADSRWVDLEDLDLSTRDVEVFDQIEAAVGAVLSHGLRPLSLGGDHSITYPILRAYSGKHPDLHILHLDAHPDLYEELDGNRHSHASPFARIMEEKLAAHLLQLGIRTMTTHQREQARRFGVEVREMREWDPESALGLEGPVYLSIDMDCLDPAFAPGVSHPEPGGFSTRDVLAIIHGIEGPIVGADIVEYNPRRDPVGITAMAAAKLLKELLAQMLDNVNRRS